MYKYICSSKWISVFLSQCNYFFLEWDERWNHQKLTEIPEAQTWKWLPTNILRLDSISRVNLSPTSSEKEIRDKAVNTNRGGIKKTISPSASKRNATEPITRSETSLVHSCLSCICISIHRDMYVYVYPKLSHRYASVTSDNLFFRNKLKYRWDAQTQWSHLSVNISLNKRICSHQQY